MSSLKPWRDAASLIIFSRRSSAKVRRQNAPFDYKLLMLKRSAKSKFMPDSYVFPGGVIDKTDLDKRWLEVFDKYGKRDYRDILQLDPKRPRPFLMRPEEGDGGLPRDLAFRICALRETFEECGMLLGQSSESISHSDLSDLRHKVHSDPSIFLSMCQHLQMCPDIWSLHEYNAWLTPYGRNDPGRRRFDAIFYTTFLDDVAKTVSIDDKEVTDKTWSDPSSILEDALLEKKVLQPPQVYELRKIAEIESFDDLRKACVKCEERGFPTLMPVLKKCDECILSFLPGDELYPKEIGGFDFNALPQIAGSIDEVNEKYPRQNRIAFISSTKFVHFNNVGFDRLTSLL